MEDGGGRWRTVEYGGGWWTTAISFSLVVLSFAAERERRENVKNRILIQYNFLVLINKTLDSAYDKSAG